MLGALLVGLAVAAVIALTNPVAAFAALPPGGRRHDLPDSEMAIISQVAAEFGIDADFLAALRRAENGGPGREFGVLSVPAPTYMDQVTIAARTIRNTVTRYEEAFGIPATEGGRYTEDFIRKFSGGWRAPLPSYPGYAPLGAGNDPTGLNANHARNLLAFYA